VKVRTNQNSPRGGRGGVMIGPDEILRRIQQDTMGVDDVDVLSRYISQHVAIGIAYMRGSMGEQWTREFMEAAYLAADAHGVETYTHPDGGKIVLPREPSTN
jgi:hypothetical protein